MPPRLLLFLVLSAVILVERDVARRLSATFDELVDLGNGVHAVTHGEVRLGLEHAPLPKVLAGATVFALGARERGAAAIQARIDREAGQRVGAQELYARELLLRDNPGFGWRDARPGLDALVEAGRAPMVVFPLLLLLVAWAWGRELHGERGGLVALGLAATWPDLLGHGALVASDVPLAATGLLAAYALRCVARRGGWPRLVGLGAALGLLLASKLTAVFLGAGLLGVALVLACAPPDPAPLSPAHPFGQGTAARRVPALLLALLAVGLTALAALAATFLGHDPIAAYRASLASVYLNAAPGYLTGFLGDHVAHTWAYYPVALALKAPLPTLALLLLALGVAARAREARVEWRDELLLHGPALLLLGVTCGFGAQVGTRYLLPVMPFLFVSAGRLGRWADSPRRRLLLGLLLGLNLAGSVRDHPFHGSANSLLAGDPRSFHRLLDDSNQDWGQGLEALGAWQRRAGVPGQELVVVSRDPLFEPAQLEAYGVEGEALPAGPAALEALFFPRPGRVYAVSTHVVSRGRLQARELARAAPPGTRPAELVLGGRLSPGELVGGGFLIFDLR